MKYVVVLGDGMADYPIPELDGKTPLEYAHTPCLDALAKAGQVGAVQTVPAGMKPGSDVANLSVMGYPPQQFYSGRSPLEALSIGVDLKDADVAIRANLVTLGELDGELYMEDYSAGEIPTEEARELIEAVQSALGDEEFKFYAGVSYRHCLVWNGGTVDVDLTPPHDISGKKIKEYLPKGERAEKLKELIFRSNAVLKNHPVNQKRIAEGKRPATNIWLWGAGTKPQLESFEKRYGLKGAVVSAVDLLKGIAKGTGMACPDVEGATGTLSTNFEGKRDAALRCLDEGADYVYIHLEAPDECGHQGDLWGKVQAIEAVDRMAKWMQDGLEKRDEDYVIAVLPDHETPISVRTHKSGAVPYLIYNSRKPAVCELSYTENEAKKGIYLPEGSCVIREMMK